ncbi:MAG: hypothetical protein HYX68_27355 [Planctomycetes bacterium]|nr:hypothetical protein [Planctomycetota bacterium]
MKPFTFEIETDVIQRFPRVSVGSFVVTGLEQAAAALHDAAKVAEQVRNELVAKGISIQNLAVDVRVAGWRQAIATCGLKASTYKSSPEQLGRRYLKGDTISTPLPVVNAYCAVSSRHLAPMAGYDLDRFPNPQLALRMGRPGSDAFHPLGGRADDMPITPEVVVYASGSVVVCWAFNHRDSQDTCLTADTRDAVFFAEAVTAVQQEAMNAALSELAGLLREGGADVGPMVIADATSPSFTLCK